MLVPPESSPAVLVMIRSKSVPICNRSLARLDDSSWNRAFWREYPNLMHSYGGLLRFHARRANSGKITISKGVPLFDALVRGESPHPAAPFIS